MRQHLLQIRFARIAALGLPLVCWSQPPDAHQSAVAARSGTVSGTIYATDTNAPIRFGQLTLVPISGLGKFSQQLLSGIDLEGRFVFRRVPEGKYYLSANVAGYLNPLPGATAFQLDSMSLDEQKRLKKRLTEIDVNAEGAANLAIRLDRAAEIDGTVLFDDGSPASGLSLKIAVANRESGRGSKDAEHDSSWSYLNAYSPSTDDRGQFRIVGLQPGSYLLSASLGTLRAERQGDYVLASARSVDAFGLLTVFFGDTFRSKDAKVILVGEGESVMGVDITIPLSKLHMLSGFVTYRRTGQALPASLVRVLYSDTLEEVRSAFAVDGEFQIAYLPEGSYVLEAEPLRRDVPEGDDAEQFMRSGQKLFFNPSSAPTARVPVSLTADMTGVTITIPDAPITQIIP